MPETPIEKLAKMARTDDEDPVVETQDVQVRTSKYPLFPDAKEPDLTEDDFTLDRSE